MARLRAPHGDPSALLSAARRARAQAIGDALRSLAVRRLVSRAAILLVLGMAFLV
jgi:hypothetical protein